MQYKLSYTLFIKHFIEKKLEYEFSLYIDEKTQNILHFTNVKDDIYYEKIYDKVITIEQDTAAADRNYAKEIWEKITNNRIIQIMLIYYGDLVAYHFQEDINYEDPEDQQQLIYKLFPKTCLSYLGHHTYLPLHQHYTPTIIEEYIKTIIHKKRPPSFPKNNQAHKSYSCISKYYPSFFEYTCHRKPSPCQSPKHERNTPEEETIAYIHSWMQ